MGWMQKLCEAYDVGIVSDQHNENPRLIPVGFVRETVKYHIILSNDGEFVSAEELNVKGDEKESSEPLEIPVTVRCESYTGDKGTLRPLITKLKYLVDSETTSKWFSEYMSLLRDWSEQTGAPACLSKVYRYLNSRTLLEDLTSQVNITLNYYKDKEKREGLGSDANEMVCFSVQMPDYSCDDLWHREDVKESWRKYYAAMLSKSQTKSLCYVEGTKLPILDVHPRVAGLGTPKLIPERDEKDFPFEYRGRFVDEKSAVQISADASMRAHHALGWLIARQGLKKYGMTWVVWNVNGAVMNVPVADSDILDEEEEEDDDEYEDENSKPPVDT
ncbi:MAG: type I-C CRISPR-associated protein Cas8c/Csd1, partial [Oscillospiraceae bacterium]|nr:type I-C CRISPR-associated protein Cas8c/Csd1 [Oscillospiraceae bacterium]